MMKKTTQTLLLVLSSLLLLISVTESASAQRRTDRYSRYGRSYVVSGTVRWRKDKGTVPMGPGNSRAGVDPCDAFSVVATEPGSGKAIVYMDKVSSPFQRADEGDYYVCRYSLKVPGDRNMRMIATMGGILLLPKEDPSPMYSTDAWIGGSQSKPPRGYIRAFTGYEYVTLSSRRPRAVVNFEMVYVRVDPN